MKGRFLALGALLALCALLLCSCGRGGVKSEKEIMADILEKGVMDVMAVSDVPIEEISSLKILKRQTNKEIKNDFVYVTVEADTETAHFVRSMKLTYNYYDDQGWVLDEYEPYEEGENITTPKKAPDEQVLENFFNRFSTAHSEESYFVDYSSWTLDDVTADLEKCEATMQVTASRETKYIKTTESLTMTAHFMPDSCSWVVDGDSVGPFLTKLTYELNVETGSYHCDDPTVDLMILEFNSQGRSITAQMNVKSGGNYSGTFVFDLVYTDANPGLDLDYIQETAADKEELNTLSFIQFSATIGEYTENNWLGSGGTRVDEVRINPAYTPYRKFSPLSYWTSHLNGGRYSDLYRDRFEYDK